MKKTIKLLLAIIAAVSILYACNNEEDYTDLLKAKNDLTSNELKVNMDSLSSEEGEIIPIEVNPDSIKSKLQIRSSSYNSSLSDNLRAIRDLPISLKVRGGIAARCGSSIRPDGTRPPAGQKNWYLATNGKGKELTLVPSVGSRTQAQFYLKILPATSGIPYLIYSRKENTPISVGQYSNNPDKKVLFVRPNNSEPYNSASWDIIDATNNPGYVVIESQSYIGHGSSGNWQDIFYYVVEGKSNKTLGFGKYQQKATQEFMITTINTFALKKIEYVNENAAKVTPRTNYGITRSYTNTKHSRVSYDMKFEEDISENSYFKEQKNINFKLSGLDTKFKRPSVIQGKIDLIPSENVKADALYTSSEKINNTLSSTLPLSVPPRTKIEVIYFFKTYNVEANYEATIEYNTRTAKLKGVWNGVIHVDEIPVSGHRYKMTNLDTGETKSVIINVTKATKSNPIIL
jgi:hypothetical protein